MQISGTVTQILPLQTGTGKNGEWKKQDFILETSAQYPKKVCISLWGAKIDEANLIEGTQVDVQYDLESREYNGRWYTDVKAWSVKKQGLEGPTSLPPEDFPMEDPTDGLPF